jgi:hypothetical protein
MNEQLLAQIINGMRINQPQGEVGNVTNNELARFVADPMNNTDTINAMRNANIAGGSVGNVSDTEMSMFSGSPVGGALAGMAGGVSNPMPRINEMRNNLATAGSVGNVSNREADFFNRFNELKKIGQRRILTDGEKQEAMLLQERLFPVEVMPPDVDNLNLSPEALRELLNVIESPNFRGFPMNGGR